MTTDTPFPATERSTQRRKLRSAFFRLEQHIYSGVSMNTEIKLGIVEQGYDAKLAALNEAIDAICSSCKEELQIRENRRKQHD